MSTHSGVKSQPWAKQAIPLRKICSLAELTERAAERAPQGRVLFLGFNKLLFLFVCLVLVFFPPP